MYGNVWIMALQVEEKNKCFWFWNELSLLNSAGWSFLCCPSFFMCHPAVWYLFKRAPAYMLILGPVQSAQNLCKWEWEFYVLLLMSVEHLREQSFYFYQMCCHQPRSLAVKMANQNILGIFLGKIRIFRKYFITTNSLSAYTIFCRWMFLHHFCHRKCDQQVWQLLYLVIKSKSACVTIALQL